MPQHKDEKLLNVVFTIDQFIPSDEIQHKFFVPYVVIIKFESLAANNIELMISPVEGSTGLIVFRGYEQPEPVHVDPLSSETTE